jgi:sialidase-1
MLNMRSYRGKGCRAVSFSRDEGETWSTPVDEPQLVDSVCQASILRYRYPDGRAGPLLFSNPAARERINMTVKMSDDDGGNWSGGRLLLKARAAYSCLESLPDGRVGCLFEAGVEHPYERIALARLELSDCGF